ncbi:MAG: adenosine deaminase [Lachnospiraceae bacterium]|nr:adenosine deaminase [Lachnospiraceae bacterium]
MSAFGRFYLDKEKDMIVDLFMEDGELSYVLRTPNHGTGNLITNLAKLCNLPISFDEQGLKVIKGRIPSYIDDDNRTMYIFRLADTKIANIFPDGTIERKASIPAISKTLMSQTKDYQLGAAKTIVKTYILSECKFRTDLHTHMNANLDPDVLIALGICHQIAYPLYYIKKLNLRITKEQEEALFQQREQVAEDYRDSTLTGKYLTRKIDDHTVINFADLILNNLENAAYNIPKIRASLAVMKDGQAVFTNLEKVYLYRYVFTKGTESEEKIVIEHPERIPDREIAQTVKRMLSDRENPAYRRNTLFQDKLLWIARGYQHRGIVYAEISDTTLVKRKESVEMLRQVHEVMPAVSEETGVMLRFLAGIRRIPLTLVKDNITGGDYFKENLEVLREVAPDPYVAGSDIIGEEINDIRDLKAVIRELVHIAKDEPGFVIRIHAGENDSLRDNVANSLRCVKEALAPGQTMPYVRIGHGLYTANLKTAKGKQLMQDLKDAQAVLEFQISSNVRLNNLSRLENHPLKTYLQAGVLCVQGTDGGALYGTDSIDEELSLEKLLGLSREELMQMRAAEDLVLQESRRVFAEKSRRFDVLRGDEKPEAYLAGRLARKPLQTGYTLPEEKKLDSAAELHDLIREIPEGKMPIVVMGGSFNNDRHKTRLREGECRILHEILAQADPEKVCFVVGHRMSGYEKYLAEKCAGKFELFAIVPTKISRAEKERLLAVSPGIRISIEPSGMGLYKSFAYEIFKRRPSVLIAFDGNSAGANMIQEAKNGKYKCRIFVSGHCRVLKAKASSLQGYVTVFTENSKITLEQE